METTIFLLKILLYSILGFYFVNLINIKYITHFFIPSFGLFSVISLYFSISNVIWNFIIGLIIGYLIELFKTLITNENIKIKLIYYGIINIINYYLINKIINFIIYNSSDSSKLFLYIILIISFLLDLTISLKKVYR